MNKVVITFLILALVTSCSNKMMQTHIPSTAKGLMPLAVGNSWTFTKISYDSNTGLPIDTGSDGINILSQVGVDSLTYFGDVWNSFYNSSSASFFYNSDSNTLRKVDGASDYVFFKRVSVDSVFVNSRSDTVTLSRCKGQNTLYGFTDTTLINGYNCLRNVVYVNDCTGLLFQYWVYYLKPGLGLIRVQHYVIKLDGTYYLDFQDDLTDHHFN